MDAVLEEKRRLWCLKCGGKCCVMRSADEGEVTCPRLNGDGSCSVYRRRYYDGAPDIVAIGYYKSRKYKDLDGNPVLRAFFCGKIEQIIAAGALPAEIAEKCCYARPELIEEMFPV